MATKKIASRKHRSKAVSLADLREAATAANKEESRKQALQERIDKALCKLARVRDFLYSAQEGQAAEEVEVIALFCRAALCEAAVDLERCLFESGLYAGIEIPTGGGKFEGWFFSEHLN